MTKPRAATTVLLLGVTLLGLTAAPGGAVADYSATRERALETFGTLSSEVAVQLSVVARDSVAGSGIDPPASATETSACITLTTPSNEVTLHCGPATLVIDPSLQTATVTGETTDGYQFSATFEATEDPLLIFEPGPPTTTTGVSRVGVADVDLEGPGFTSTRGSSWYAEVQDAVKSSASGK